MIDFRRFSWKLFVLALLVAGVSFSGLLFLSREYRSTAIFLVSPRSDASAETFSHDLGFLVETGAFYDRLLIEHPTFSDAMKDVSPAARELAWKRVVGVRIPSGTSIIEVSVSADTSAQSEALLRAVLETLSGFSDRLVGNEAHSVPVGEIITVISAHNPAVSAGIALVMGMMVVVLGIRTVQSSPDSRPDTKAPAQSGNALGQKKLNRKSTLRPIGSFGSVQSTSSTSTVREVAQPIKREEGNPKRPAIAVAPAHIPDNILPASPSVTTIPEKVSVVPQAEMRPPVEIQEDQLSDQKIVDKSELKKIDQKTEGEASASSESMSPAVSVQESAVLRAIEMKRLKQRAAQPPSSVLPGVPASEFSWEKYLFANEEGGMIGSSSETQKGEKQENVEENKKSIEEGTLVSDTKSDQESKPETKNSSALTEKREPTTEELKARLNKLLRGEL